MEAGEARRTVFASTTGGVMTEEAGAVTGELEVETRVEGDALAVLVRYAGAEEWYAVTGGPLALREPHPTLHEQVVDHLRRPAPVVDGNEGAVSLEDLRL